MSVAAPEATFYLFPDVTDAMADRRRRRPRRVRREALHNTGVSFCTRRHFGRPQPGEERQYVRLRLLRHQRPTTSAKGSGLLQQWIGSVT